MKKLSLIILLLTLSTSICEGQATFNTFGHFDRELLRREYFKILDDYNGKFLVVEKKAVSAISRDGRVLSIRSIDKKTLQVAESMVYKNISVGTWKDEYSFLNIWQTQDEVQVLVLDNKTQDIAMLTINAKTLLLDKKAKVLFSIDDRYKKESDVLFRLILKDQPLFGVEVACSKNKKYTYVMIYLNERGESTTMMSYLIEESGKVIAESVLKPKTDYPLSNENTILKVLDDGRAVVMMNLEAKKSHDYKDLKPGINMYIISKNGELQGQKRVLIDGTLPNGDPVETTNPAMTIKGDNLYIAGYENTGFGTVSGVLNINSNSSTYSLNFQPHGKHTIAKFWSTSEKNHTRADKGKMEVVSKFMEAKSITVAENGDFILVGSLAFVTHENTTSENSTATTTIYHFGTVLAHRFTPEKDILYTKVIHLEKSTKSHYNLPLYQHKAFEVNGEIVLFINENYSEVNGDQMLSQDVKVRLGAIVIIPKDGSKWRKESFELSKALNVCWVIPMAGVVEEDGAILMPIKPQDRTNVGYIRFQPNKK